MATLTLTNLTASNIGVGQFVGSLAPNETRQVVLTANELELTRPQLVAMTEASILQWSTAPSSADGDNQAEIVIGGARVLAGTGSPNGSVVGDPGDLYCNKSGGAGTTLFVKEAGVGTDTGWVGK